ncbi:MAG TPA: response regulator transcription factor [Actinomycetota bacterium]|nr:response regulator transcription factor [Actinomycetota bacterium]
MSLRVLLLDDHRMFADALEVLLAGESDIEVMGIATTEAEAIEVCLRDCPDVVLVDLDPSGTDGFEATARIREACGHTQAVIVTGAYEPAMMARAVEAGATGYVPKTGTARDLIDAVRRVASGELALPSADVNSVLRALQASHRTRTAGDLLAGHLTEREIQILQGFADGLTTDELAGKLFVTTSTVQTHTRNILAKVGARSKLEAVIFALRHGVIRVR